MMSSAQTNGSRSGRRLRPSVVALSLVAIVAVYAAGFMRTRAAVDAGPVGSVAGARYKDGIYTGYARRRHGGVQATVVVKRGRIASVDITLCRTRFPCTYIEALPAQVVARQRPEVDAIAGATESALTFARAVDDALARARRPERFR
jgi:uncharacterized protein with FMN-binding domain